MDRKAIPKTQTIGQADRIRTIAYWTFTLIVAFENAAGAMWVFLSLIPGLNQLHAASAFSVYLGGMLTHLGYLQYFKYILGPWQLACAAALLASRLPRIKEWAYAGAFFNYSSALASVRKRPTRDAGCRHGCLDRYFLDPAATRPAPY